MGWMCTEKPTRMSVKDFFKKEWENEYVQILDCAVVGMKTAYMAIKRLDKDYVFGMVVLLDYKGDEMYNFCYKDMDEEMGPYFYDCPERILKLLTPTERETAIKWREKCWERINSKKAKPKVNDGDFVKFSSPLSFTNGHKYDTFQVVKYGRSVRFKPLNSNTLCQISKWRDREYEIINDRVHKGNKALSL